MPQTTQKGFTRFSEERDPISRLLLAVGLYQLNRPSYTDKVSEFMRDHTSEKEWDQDREMDEQCGEKPNDYDFLEALCLVNPVVRLDGLEYPLEQVDADKIEQIAHWLASARKFQLDYEEAVRNLQHRDRIIAVAERAKGFMA